jgi:uncharacterized protein YggE
MRRFIYFLGCLCLLFMQEVQAEDALPRITVSGNATVSKPADKLSLTIGVVTSGAGVDLALKSNNEKVKLVTQALQRIGLTAKEIQTGSFTVSPQYTPSPHNPPPEWHPAIVGYEVRNTLSIHTNRLDLVGALIEAASKNGANLIQNIAFSLENTQDAEAEAIQQAIQHAQVYANVSAKAAGIALGNVRTLDVNSMYTTPRFLKSERLGLAAQQVETVISPGDVEVTASVSMVFNILPSS